ncbi:hypothetical protein [Halobaculum rarum]|uniref:hypothetical protein n=1 Tax=Halobaculum rarum TaxID=3075122 RepID=UPI0032B01F6A
MSSRGIVAAVDRRRVLALIVAIAVVATGAAATFAAAQTGYALEIDGAVDIPDTTYEVDGETVEVTEIGREAPGGTLTFDVEAPSGEYYVARIVDGEGDVRKIYSARGSESFEAELDYSVGTYAVVVTNESGDDREVYAAEPFVIQGYDVTQDVAASVDSDGTLTVDVTVEPRDDPPAFESVTVAVGDDSTRVVNEASRVNDTTYRTTIDAGQFADGEYTVVSGVRGDLAFDGTAREYYGISDAATVTVGGDSGTATATATATDTTTEPGGGSAPGGSSTATTTATATSTAGTATETPTSNGTATATRTEPSSDGTATATADAGGSETVTTTAGPTTGPTTTPPPATSVPSDGGTATADPDDTTETTGALVHPIGLALLLAVGLAALRRHEA